MTERYFEKFPIITYNGFPVRNLTEKAVFVNNNGTYNNPLVYYAYDVQEYERPDAIANRYYNDPYLAWILMLTNNVVDPYYDWRIDAQTLNDILIKKYGSLANASKIKYYRNNWYSYPDPITSSQFNILDTMLQTYYEPIVMDIYSANNPTRYRRKREDWIVQTNAVAQYSVANGTPFINDEIVNVTINGSGGTGQVAFANSTTITLQHLDGTTSSNSISSASMIGSESRSNTAVTSAKLLASNIPSAEISYWSPVTYFDYESEINQKNTTINVLNSKYSAKFSKQLTQLLK
jgi:hypothetical protein